MNTGEKIDYMIQCLKVAKAEYEYSVDYLANEPDGPEEYESWWAYLIYIFVIISLIWVYLSSAKSKLLLKTSLEYEKKEKDRIEQTNQSKLRFFTNISHEFRTPLTLILGQVDMLLQTSRVSPVVYRKILAIKRNASHMQSLITELLEFLK